MRKTVWLAAFAVVLATVAMAGHEVAVLDGTSWKVNVEPDAMAQKQGEKQFDETLTFAEGRLSLRAPRVGFEGSPYTTSKAEKTDVTFKAERLGTGEGSSLWTGTVHGNNVQGKMIFTRHDGSILTYTFKGTKLD
jgi:hypothetical protein